MGQITSVALSWSPHVARTPFAHSVPPRSCSRPRHVRSVHARCFAAGLAHGLSAAAAGMRSAILATASLVIGLGVLTRSAASAADPAGLETAWHDCVREAFAHQPVTQSKAGSQRNALDECKEKENAFVAALGVEAREDRAASQSGASLPARARAWAASVAAYVLDPVSSWIELLRH